MKIKLIVIPILTVIICATITQTHAQNLPPLTDLISYLSKNHKDAFTLRDDHFRLKVNIDQGNFPKLESHDLLLTGKFRFDGYSEDHNKTLSTGKILIISDISAVRNLDIGIPTAIFPNNDVIQSNTFEEKLTIYIPKENIQADKKLDNFCNNQFYQSSKAPKDSCIDVPYQLTLDEQWAIYCRNDFGDYSDVFCDSDRRDLYGVYFTRSLCTRNNDNSYCESTFEKDSYYKYYCAYFVDGKCYMTREEAAKVCTDKGLELSGEECVSEIDIVAYSKNHPDEVHCTLQMDSTLECCVDKDITNKKLTLTATNTGIVSSRSDTPKFKLEVSKINLKENVTISYIEIKSPIHILGSGSMIHANNIHNTVYIENYNSQVRRNNFIWLNDFDNLDGLTKENYDNFCKDNKFGVTPNKCSLRFEELYPRTIDMSKIDLYNRYPPKLPKYEPRGIDPVLLACDASKHLVLNRERNGCECDASKNFVPSPRQSVATSCVCKRGYKLENDSCVAIICPIGAKYDRTDDTCKCTDPNTEVRDWECKCKSSYHLENGSCTANPIQCPEESSDNGKGVCVCNDPNAQINQGRCVCKNGFKSVDGICEAIPETTCPAGSAKDNAGNCVCEDTNAEMINNACICKAGFQLIGGNCQPIELTTCPEGARAQAGGCLCIDPNAQLTEAGCICKNGFELIGRTCEAISVATCPARSIRDSTGNCACTDRNAHLTESGCICADGFELIGGICTPQATDPCPTGSTKDGTGSCVCMDPKAEMRNGSCQCIGGHSKINGICLPDDIVIGPNNGGGNTGENPEGNDIGDREGPSIGTSTDEEPDWTLGGETAVSRGGCSISGARSTKADGMPLFLISMAISLIIAARRRASPMK